MPPATLEKATTIAKFSIDKSALLEGLEACSRVVPAKPSHPVLANVLFSVKQGVLTLKAFDLSRSLEMRYLVDTEPDTEVSFCVTSAVKELISRLKDGEIKLEVNSENYLITFRQGKSKHKFNGMSASEFPTLPTVEGTKLALIGEVLAKGFGRVLFSVSSDETKQILTGINLQASNNQLKFASTDGHRLSCFSLTENVQDGLELTIPGKAVQDSLKLISKASSLNFECDKSQVKFETDQWCYTVRLLEGQYPNYEQLIPLVFNRKTTVNKTLFLECLDRVKLIADAKNSIVCMDISETTIRLYADVPDYGESEEEFECQNSGDSIERIAFNSKYLFDAIKNVSGDCVTFRTGSLLSPGLISGDDTARFLIMPVQIRS